MKKFLLSTFLMLSVFAAAADAQLFASETVRKAVEKLNRGDTAGAVAVLDRAIKKHKDLLEAYQLRANLRLMNRDLEGAAADYSAAIELSPLDAKNYERRAKVRRLLRDYSAALKDYDDAIANGLKAEKVFAARAMIKRDMGDVEGAIADYRTALALNPYLAIAENGLTALLEHDKGDFDGAFTHRQQFLERYEAARDGRLPKLKDDYPAEVSFLLGPDDNTKSVTQVGMSPVSTGAKTPEELERYEARQEQLANLAIAYANLGRMYVKKNDFDSALESYEKGLKIREGDAYLHRLRAELRIKKGDLGGAIEDLTVAINANEGAPDVHLERGLLLTLRGEDDEAEKEFAAYLQMFPQGREYINRQVTEAKKLRSEQSQP